MSIIKKVFYYEETKLPVIKYKNEIWAKTNTVANILRYTVANILRYKNTKSQFVIMLILKTKENSQNYAGINLTGYHSPRHPRAFAPKCVHSPRAFAQQKIPGGWANK